MFRPRRPLIPVPTFSSPDLCVLCVSVFSPLSSFCSGGSSDPCSSPLPSSSDPTIPFRITSFADPHHLTPIESHLCKKQGRGWSPCQRLHSAQSLPIFSTPSKHATHRNARNSTLFMTLLHGSLDTRGWGMPPRAASTTHYPLFPTHYSYSRSSPRTSTLPPPNYGIIPPHRGTTYNPICARGGFSD